MDITVDPTPLFDDLPNVLTPNGDGVNDSYSFPPLYDKCYNYIFSVFNRWGAKVFETESSAIGFGGISNLGSDLQDGVYFWILVGNGIGQGQDQEIKKSGTITVVGTK
jgi:gliding motility-associated-like protein